MSRNALLYRARRTNKYVIKQLNSNEFLGIDIDISDNINKVDNIIISLTTIPSRFVTNDFLYVIDSLYNQILKPKNIYIHLCKTYNRKFDFDEDEIQKQSDIITQKYNNVIINYSKDYGPITKILGLLNINCSDNDKIIIVDDDWVLNSRLTLYYELCYEIYNCECVGVNERDIIDWTIGMENPVAVGQLFIDNYQNFLYGWLTYSIKFKYVKQLYSFYVKITSKNTNIEFHDDLIVSLFYKSFGLYTCGINILFNSQNRLSIDYKDALRDMNRDSSFAFRSNLEKEYLTKYNYAYHYKKNHIYIENLNSYNNNFILMNCNERWLLSSTNIHAYNDNMHVLITYINTNTCIVTVTFFNVIKSSIDITIESNKINISLNPNNWSMKQSFLCNINYTLVKETDDSHQFNIIQSLEYETTRDTFHKISSVLTTIPLQKYLIFNDYDRIAFIKNNYPKQIYECYSSLINTTHKQELFTNLYIYLYGGLYINHNCILYININKYIQDELYIKNTNIIYFSKENILFTKKNIAKQLVKIINQQYDSNTVINAFNENDENTLNFINNEIYTIDNVKICTFIENKNDITFINNIGFNQIPIPYNKINLIDHIVWINLKRSKQRYMNMLTQLSKININHSNIEAFDGREINLHEKMPDLDNSHLSSAELATTFSHIKAISALSQLEGDYFLVCEDDISLYNIFLFDNDLKDIIEKSPTFDILQIQKIVYFKDLENKYNKLTDLIEMFPGTFVSGTAAYIISKEGVKNFMSNVARFEDNKLILVNKNLHVADMYIYRYVNTIVYKYNFINTLDKDSEIHSDHLDQHRASTEFEIELIVNTLL